MACDGCCQDGNYKWLAKCYVENKDYQRETGNISCPSDSLYQHIVLSRKGIFQRSSYV